MPRHKTFSPDAALDDVLELFWERGYHGTPIRMVADHLNLSRSSIYQTFGDKQALFVQALRRYGRCRVPGLGDDTLSPRGELVAMFEQTAAQREARGHSCLLIDTALELEHVDAPEVARVVGDALGNLEERLREAIDRGQAVAEIAGAVDSVQTARVLLCLYLGLYVRVRTAAGGAPALDAVLQQVQELLPAESYGGLSRARE